MTERTNPSEATPAQGGDEIRSTLAPVFAKWTDKISAVYLFGSTAGGQAGPGSDIDLAILLADQHYSSGGEIRIDLYVDCSKALKRNDIDIIILNSTRNLFLINDVITNGVVLFDRDPGFREEFEVKKMHDFIEFQEHRRKVMGV